MSDTVNGYRFVRVQTEAGSHDLLAFVKRISGRGTAYFVKPNPWALRDGDRRAGWTKVQNCRAEQLVGTPTAEQIKAVVDRIGPPRATWGCA